ncbi:2-(1,2-epoxy-1,2-dihydrophenyl)acetyl-CoA isomerase PaaG [Bartonella apis]|uniref:2-(1,2-epoxy-1,2-dihydrophenyl)acetyl-CoA isomerase PaaG n=1 Tax=Bartonella apis TaxID=1686310 RepID=UPI0018DBBC05|nr:2-(1,2-epoxy-1,2-dihydrophenyl)acetyl-CoA isomerase PaaG [Bartonella apis]MBI0177824.1 2-(1,2-epoxy-1,2-dihydrophenyl)acetyl-CoA isomerase [Bartonella apis]
MDGHEQPILVKNHQSWHEIILNRPEKLNAFTDDMHRALVKALDAAAGEDCRAVLLSASGRGFCAGQDLNMRVSEGGPHDLGATIEEFYNPLIRRLRRLQKPVICAVNGVAAGAGANIALSCDIVLAAKSARFIQAFARIGLIPDSGGTFFLPRLIGDARARALIMTGEAVSAQQAHDWGMIWKVYDDKDLHDEAVKLAKWFAAQPTQGLALAKEALNYSSSHSLDEQLDFERDQQRKAGFTPDYREGVTAFMEKRLPSFTGRKA